MSALRFDVVGSPGAQGSKRHVGNGIMIESSAKVAPWRQDVTAAACEAMGDGWTKLDGSVKVTIIFFFRRPKSHYGTGKNAASLKKSAPRHPISQAAGDVDKLARSTLDALTIAGVFGDDSQVCNLRAVKRYCHVALVPGAHISIESSRAALRQEHDHE